MYYMYLYVEKCAENDMVPVKSHIYRNILNTEFIIDFHVQKKYRCEKIYGAWGTN